MQVIKNGQLTQDGKEELAVALILLQYYKKNINLDLTPTTTFIQLANYLNILSEVRNLVNMKEFPKFEIKEIF